MSWAADGSLLVIWRMIPCVSPLLLAHQLVSPVHAQLIACTLALTAPTYFVRVCDRLQAASHPRFWSREFRKEVNPSHALFLQEFVHLKQTKGREWVAVAPGCLTPGAPSPLASYGCHTAVLHWQALCSYTHAKAASWRTALVSPAPDERGFSHMQKSDLYLITCHLGHHRLDSCVLSRS